VTEFHEDGRAGIDAELVRRLIAQQFPQWADLPVTPVKVDGWDNRTYRLGSELTARLPTHSAYVAAVPAPRRCRPGRPRGIPSPGKVRLAGQRPQIL
jgi:hypothetical protein